ncbi:hypothetical protein CF326_g6677 [Tilletia indica]|nr:hypothetical protein CF326_g6677 [Tilletia indica]
MSAGPSSARMVIDLTNSSDEERNSNSALQNADDSIEFISATRRNYDPTIPGPASSSSYVPPSLQPSTRLGPHRSPTSEPSVQNDVPEMLDSDMGDETRQLLAEMMEDEESFSSLDEEAPLASLSLLSPAKSSTPKRPRGRPRKLALAPSGGGDDDDDDEPPDDENEGDGGYDDEEDEEEAEPDSLYISSALSYALAEAVKADHQLWLRILRFEPIPIEELTSLATRSASLHTKKISTSSKRSEHEQASSSSLKPGQGATTTSGKSAKAWKEWNALLAGPQKRLELAIQSWADEQGICSFTEEGRNDKRKARQAVRSRNLVAAADDDNGSDDAMESSPSKRRRKGGPARGMGKERSQTKRT